MFYESNEQQTILSNEDIFQKYKEYLSPKSRFSTKSSKGGAILLCVINGKLSEGINFSDELGRYYIVALIITFLIFEELTTRFSFLLHFRCVVIVGVPFPNPNDPLIKEKLKYYSAKRGTSRYATSHNEYLENMSMKSVNQAIGRAIRHKDDYAAIVLLDGLKFLF